MKTIFKPVMTVLFLFSCCVTFGGNTTAHSLNNPTENEESLINSWLNWITDTGFEEGKFEFAELEETIALTISWTTSFIFRILFDLTIDFNNIYHIITGSF